ncbi:hypothetical protein [Nocardia asiatica]|uniref:hypothetical protein n=1 Tax=Nocardia asiatica TaxID=209252 RepID=UPI002457A3F0|nr:hypothetical protein [Nocardia asiatica]
MNPAGPSQGGQLGGPGPPGPPGRGGGGGGGPRPRGPPCSWMVVSAKLVLDEHARG